MYSHINYIAPAPAKVKAPSASKAAKAAKDKAFGPRPKGEKYFYSKHNLEMKYASQDPDTILRGRVLTAERYGYNPAMPLGEEENDQLRDLDYADSLMLANRARLANVFSDSMCMDLYHADWSRECMMVDAWTSAALSRMMLNFIHDVGVAKAAVRCAQERTSAVYVIAWAKDLMEEIEAELGLYHKIFAAAEAAINTRLEDVH